jgi:hypothetical protein
MSSAKDTLLFFLVDQGEPSDSVSFPWEHPQVGDLPNNIKEQMAHAKYFSESIHGAALLYNLMLAQLIENPGFVEEYESKFSDWANQMSDNLGVFRKWDRTRFWQIVRERNDRIPGGTRSFVDEWFDLAFANTNVALLANNRRVQGLIRDREKNLKRGQARLENRRALELWTGASGTSQLDYRWKVAQTIVADIHAGRDRKGRNA